MNKQRKHYFNSFLSFFQISAEETGRNYFFRVEKNAFFSALEETGEPWVWDWVTIGTSPAGGEVVEQSKALYI